MWSTGHILYLSHSVTACVGGFTCYRTKRFSDTQRWRDGQQWLATVTCELKKLPVFFRTFEKQSLCQTHDHIISSLISSLSIVNVGHWISSDQLMLVYWTHAVSVMGTTFHCTSAHRPVWLWYTAFIANNNELRCVCWSILQSIGLRWKEETKLPQTKGLKEEKAQGRPVSTSPSWISKQQCE